MEVDVSVVTYRTEPAALHALAASLAEEPIAGKLSIYVHDNSESHEAMRTACARIEAQRIFARVVFTPSPRNVGFGLAHNANARLARAPLFFVLNPDCVLEPGALDALVRHAHGDSEATAAWEMRQIPYEHPKAYDPVTLETSWVSGAATLFRRRDFDAAGGFDPRIFLYGEDVDLSWRLRASGRRLRYVPRAAVVHHTYAEPWQVKPQQAFGSIYASLALRTRFGRPRSIAKGLVLWALELMAPESFPGRRRGTWQAGMRYLGNAAHFLATRVAPTGDFRPIFRAWGYELRRDGDFHAMHSCRARPASLPRVSILVRTTQRPAWLAQALASCAHQTYPNLEVVVVEDGEPVSEPLVRSWSERLPVRYVATGERVGRARAGNIALANARGEWLNFLDDDDVLFADHVEVLVEAAVAAEAVAAYGFAWETATAVIDRERALYEEAHVVPRHRPAFDRARLWRQNYLPIQSVLFHRTLWERHGGFAEDMQQLEDWNLWTRYSLSQDFLAVEKTTSKYRVPHAPAEAARRQAALDAAYPVAVARQEALRLALPAHERAALEAAIARFDADQNGWARRLARAVPALHRIAVLTRPLRSRLLTRRAALRTEP